MASTKDKELANLWPRLKDQMRGFTSKQGWVLVVQLVRESKRPKEEVHAALDAALDRGEIEAKELGNIPIRPVDKPLAWKRNGVVLAFIRLTVGSAKAEIPFAQAVLLAAQAAQRAGGDQRVFGDDKVFISAVFEEFRKLNPRMALPEFKERLIDSQRRGDVHLSRADMVEMMPPEVVARSETIREGTRFHFVRLQGRYREAR